MQDEQKEPRRASQRTFPALVGIVAAGLALAGCTSPAPGPASGGTAEPPTEALEAVPMVNHVQFGVFEQDVFLGRPAEPGKVYRATPGDAASPLYADAALYATKDPQEHDPTFSDGGPFDQGAPLGLTLRAWLAGRGSAAYLCTGGTTARIDASFSSLVPGGLYTFWNARLDFKEGKITGGEDIAAGPLDGSANTFRADEQGNARFRVAWEGCNEPSTGGPGIGPDGSARVLAIAYHSDGKTYGPGPGHFGQVSHVQLFGFMRGAKE